MGPCKGDYIAISSTQKCVEGILRLDAVGIWGDDGVCGILGEKDVGVLRVSRVLGEDDDLDAMVLVMWK